VWWAVGRLDGHVRRAVGRSGGQEPASSWVCLCDPWFARFRPPGRLDHLGQASRSW